MTSNCLLPSLVVIGKREVCELLFFVSLIEVVEKGLLVCLADYDVVYATAGNCGDLFVEEAGD
jgi:hypothetical protein